MDGFRSLTLAGACAAFVGVPTLGAVLGGGEQTRRYDGVITPPDYAFAIWAPIFAGCVASTIAQCRPAGRADPVSRRTGWPLIGAYAVNTAWSLAAQSGRFGLTPYLLPVATAFAATAHARLQRLPGVTRDEHFRVQHRLGFPRAHARPERLAPSAGTDLPADRPTPASSSPPADQPTTASSSPPTNQFTTASSSPPADQPTTASSNPPTGRLTAASTGLLLGWTALASAVNAIAATQPRTVAAPVAGLLATSAAIAGTVAASHRGRASLATASGWGLTTLALMPSRPRTVRVAAAAGAAAVALAVRNGRRAGRTTTASTDPPPAAGTSRGPSAPSGRSAATAAKPPRAAS